MDKQDYINEIEDLTVDQIILGITDGIVTFDELRKSGQFDASKQKVVRKVLDKKDDKTFASSKNISELRSYISLYPKGNHLTEAESKIRILEEDKRNHDQHLLEQEQMLLQVKNNINEYTPDEIVAKLSDEVLNNLCVELGIDIQMLKNYQEPTLKFNTIPKTAEEIPPGYTDVFFWGIPSSGKTCALSAILSTIKKNYSMEAPDCDKKYGATYRDSLVNIFLNDSGYLPGRTNEDRTQYMPFLFYKRGEKNKRRISFFELSGEVFKYFYEKVNDTQIVDDYDRENIEQSFKSLELLLNSANQKIHFFFIDYNQETKHSKDDIGLTQDNYLGAAADYFRDKNDIFKKKTDAVYVVVTKSDEIPGSPKERVAVAKTFLQENFSSFMSVLMNQCGQNSIDFNIKIFSIGDVYFKKICKINRAYSTDIINDLLKRVKPINNNIFRKFFNS